METSGPKLQMPERKKFRAVSWGVLRYIAWQNIANKKLRSSLTVVGIVIGIGAICFLLSFGLGLRNLVTNEILGSTSVKSVDITNPNPSIVKLDDKQINRIKEVGHITDTGASYSFPSSLTYNNSEIDAVTFGVDPTYQRILNLPLVTGRTIQTTDGKVAVINTATLQSMGIRKAEDIIGKKLELRIPIRQNGESRLLEETVNVVGVFESGSGSEIYVPNFIFENAKIADYSQVKVLIDKPENVSTVRQQIESFGLETASPIDTIAEINQVFKFFNFVLIGFGAIGMVVAILGMFNTLTISLLERTREIGLMVALGARRRDVRLMFIVEALLLSFIGAVGGILGAVTFGILTNIIMLRVARSRGVVDSFVLFSFPWWLSISLIVGMLIVGFVVAYLPARRAENINPIDALRRE